MLLFVLVIGAGIGVEAFKEELEVMSIEVGVEESEGGTGMVDDEEMEEEERRAEEDMEEEEEMEEEGLVASWMVPT